MAVWMEERGKGKGKGNDEGVGGEEGSQLMSK